jgi:hypothetical protein
VTDNVGLAVEEGAGIVRLTSSVEVINSIAGVLEGDASVSTSLHPVMISRTIIQAMRTGFPDRFGKAFFINLRLSKVIRFEWYK